MKSNNYPFSIGRDFDGIEIDNNEIIQIKLAQPLDLDPRLGAAAVGSGGNGGGNGGSGGSNVIDGTDEGERLTDSLAGDDTFNGGGGDDVIIGDRLRINGEPNPGYNDTINGDSGNDILRGRGGDDLLFGGEGHDKLLGDDGDDILSGGAGSDILSGGAGSDTFVLTAEEGTDIIRDFVVGTDVIELTGGLSFGALTFSNRTIIFEDEVVARFTGVDPTALTAESFVAG